MNKEELKKFAADMSMMLTVIYGGPIQPPVQKPTPKRLVEVVENGRKFMRLE